MECAMESDTSAKSRAMGTLTGWQMIALEVMETGDNEDEEEESDGCHPAPRAAASKSSRDLNCFPSASLAQSPLDLPSSLNSQPKDLPAIITDKSQRRLEDKESKFQSPVAKSNTSFFNDYQLVEEIGAGAFGRAMKAIRIADKELVVVKEVKIGLMSDKERHITKNEVKVLANLNHPNIVKYYDSYADKLLLHIVMEYCDGGDVSHYLKSKSGQYLSEQEVMQKFMQISLALHYVHRQGILHRDLKGSNIFLAENGIVKLGDFGISKVLSDYFAMAQSVVGTPNYLSPEICKSKPYGVKSDIWALGCVLYELCCLKPAFDGTNLPAVVIQILSGKYKPIPEMYSPELKKLLSRLLAKNPKNRPTLEELLSYDYCRHHLELYYRHVNSKITRRLSSFKNSLEHFNLDGDVGSAPIISIMTGAPLHTGLKAALVTDPAKGDWNKAADLMRLTSQAEGASPQIKAHMGGLQNNIQFSDASAQATGSDLVSLMSSDTALAINSPRPGSFLQSVQSDTAAHEPCNPRRPRIPSMLSQTTTRRTSEFDVGPEVPGQAISQLSTDDTALATEANNEMPGTLSQVSDAEAVKSPKEKSWLPEEADGSKPQIPAVSALKVAAMSTSSTDNSKTHTPTGSTKRLKVNFGAALDGRDPSMLSSPRNHVKLGKQASRRDRTGSQSIKHKQADPGAESLKVEQLQTMQLVRAARCALPVPPPPALEFDVVKDVAEAVRAGNVVLTGPEWDELQLFGASHDSQEGDPTSDVLRDGRSRTSTLSEETCALMQSLHYHSESEESDASGEDEQDREDDEDDEEDDGAEHARQAPKRIQNKGLFRKGRHLPSSFLGDGSISRGGSATSREQNWALRTDEQPVHI